MTSSAETPQRSATQECPTAPVSSLAPDETPRGPFPKEKVSALRLEYFATISYVDAQIGRLLDALEEEPAEEDRDVYMVSVRTGTNFATRVGREVFYTVPVRTGTNVPTLVPGSPECTNVRTFLRTWGWPRLVSFESSGEG